MAEPIKASHIFLKKLLASSVGAGWSPQPAELDRCSQVFRKLGGSWVRVFEGKAEDINRLKKILALAAKKGHLSKTPFHSDEK